MAFRRFLVFRKRSSTSRIPKDLSMDPEWIVKNEPEYKLRDLGYGGCGNTQLWNLPGHNEPVCLKKIFDPCTQYEDTLKETNFLILLKGAGGAPKVHGLAPDIGVYFMDYVSGCDLEELHHEHTVGNLKYDDLFWLKVFEEVIVKLKEVHKKEVVHLDLKLNNVIVDVSDVTDPKVSIIDFGVSGKVGDRWVLGDRTSQNIDRFLNACPWYSYEASVGQRVSTKCDVVAVSRMVTQICEVMDRKPVQLLSLAQRGMDRDVESRPSLNTFLKTVRKIRVHWEKKFNC